MTGPTEPQTPLWRPAPARAAATRLQQFLDTLRERHGLVFSDYAELHAWSVRESEAFWRALWDFCGVIGEPGERVLVDGQRMEHAQWFPDGRLNFAENLLRRRGPEEAMLLQVEDQPRRRLSWDELYDEVSRVAQLLRSYGVQPGDRVAGYLPNLPETAIGMLATAAVGAVWTSTSPDFGVESVIERFGQVGPRVLFGVEAYQYNGKRHVLGDKLRRICAGLPSIEHLVVFPLFGGPVETPGVSWHEALAGFRASEIEFEPRGFGDPLCVLYSSGTTGKPKCITHRVGGVLLQHLKEHQLHSDVSHDDRVFYFTTCGWMMWNWLVSALASGATVIFYDGSPFFPDGNVLLDLAQEEGITLFGTSAKYIDELRNRGIVPSRGRDFPRLRTLCSTGSVLVPEAFDWVYENFKRDLCLASISGGTDIISCFVLGNPLLPVYRGECQCRGLG
ncbi:MAG: acetoacetate--CoA ligase, partial [Gammaproteobacteria bacterium]|nr:acetoacetate--CoA ligase [Gammaproteobacteria bacterium]